MSFHRVDRAATPTADNWMNSGVLVLNVTFEALTEISADRAIVLLVAGAAESVADAEPRFPIRSRALDLALPRTIRLMRYVYVRHQAIAHYGTRATFAAVLRRDKYRCGYCDARFAHTVDHVLPRSRGGADSWGNLVACCATCNSSKGDRTPAEAGMRLLWEPKPPRDVEKTQRRIWRELASA